MNNTRADSPMVLNVQEASAVLKVSPNTIRKAIHDGQIHAVRIGGRKFLIPRNELERLLCRPANTE